MLPTARLVDALQAFRTNFPTVALRLHVEALGGVTELVVQGKAVIGVSNPMHAGTEGLERIFIGGVDMIPVAAPSHPLAKKRRAPQDASQDASKDAARDHIQLVLTDRSPLTAGQDFAVLSDKTWRLADLGAKHALLLAGVGWGNMPEAMIRDDLKAGRLVRLKLRDWRGAEYGLQAIYRTAVPPGPAAQWLIARFVAQMAAGRGQAALRHDPSATTIQ
jgi:DNA-binding transcriptional LysR family regulator